MAFKLTGKFEINKSVNGKYYFVLKARNGEVIATSEMYEQKASALVGIRSVKRTAVLARVVDKTCP